MIRPVQYSCVALSLLLGLACAPIGQNISVAKTGNTQKPAATKIAPKAPASKANPSQKAPAKGIVDTSYREVEPLNLVREPERWIGEKVTFQGNFVSFSPVALDYKGAMRSSKDYISFMVQRPDVTHHVIPLSELKLVLPRKKADKALDFESGDQVMVKGRVFSAALGDPWMDVDELLLLKKTPENLAKAKKDKRKPELE